MAAPGTGGNGVPGTDRPGAGGNPGNVAGRSRSCPWLCWLSRDDNAEAHAVNSVMVLVEGFHLTTMVVGNQSDNQQTLAQVAFALAYPSGDKGTEDIHTGGFRQLWAFVEDVQLVVVRSMLQAYLDVALVRGENPGVIHQVDGHLHQQFRVDQQGAAIGRTLI